MMSWIDAKKRQLGTFGSRAVQVPDWTTSYRSFTTQSFSQMLGRTLPTKSRRYLHAMGAMGFLVSIVVAMDWMTTIQLKASPYFEYSFKVVTQNEEVQKLLGPPIKTPWRVSVRKHKRRFQLRYSLKGENGQWAQVVAASTIDAKRGAINDESFRYIVVQPTSIRQLCFGVITEGLYELAAIVGKDNWFSESEEDAKKRRETEILVVDRVSPPTPAASSSASL